MPKKIVTPKPAAKKPVAKKSAVKKPAAKKTPARQPEPVKAEVQRAEASEFTQELSFMKFKGEAAKLLPWVKGERGTQCYYKLKQGERSAFLYAGEAGRWKGSLPLLLRARSRKTWSH
jgi:hypothetical protein